MLSDKSERSSKLRTLEDVSIVYAMRHRLEPKSQALSRFKWTLKNKFLRVHNSLWMLILIANTMESSGFSVLNSFLGNTYKKEDGMEKIRERATPRGSLFWTHFLVILIKRGWIEKENKTNRNVGLIVLVRIIKCDSAYTLDTKRILRWGSLR